MLNGIRVLKLSCVTMTNSSEENQLDVNEGSIARVLATYPREQEQRDKVHFLSFLQEFKQTMSQFREKIMTEL